MGPVMPDVGVRARKRGSRWEGQFRFGGYWFPVKRQEQVLTYASADAARAAAAVSGGENPRLNGAFVADCLAWRRL